MVNNKSTAINRYRKREIYYYDLLALRRTKAYSEKDGKGKFLNRKNMIASNIFFS